MAPSNSSVSPTRNSTFAWLLLIGIAVIAFVALGSLLKTRYESGESYPPYSTKLSSPLGTRALYESLAETSGIRVEQNFLPIEKLEGAPGTALVMCGLNARSFNASSNDDAKHLGTFVASGGRLIIALDPSVTMGHVERALHDAEKEVEEERLKQGTKTDPSPDKDEDPAAKPKKPDEPTAPKVEKPEPAKEPSKKTDKTKPKKHIERTVSLAETFKIAAKVREFFYSGNKDGSTLTLRPEMPLAVDDTPPWMSNVFLDDDPTQDWHSNEEVLSGLKEQKGGKGASKGIDSKPDGFKPTESSPWITLATKGDRVMIAERRLGLGSVILCTDRYFLSNEALWKGSKPKFITWLLGDAKRIIFEETHLAMMMGDDEGIMTLARRYRMEGLFLGGILLFALYVWRSSFSLVPPNADDDLGHWRGDAIAGRGNASGLEGLLRRGIATRALLGRCFDTWRSTRSASQAVPADRFNKAVAIMAAPDAHKHPVATYRAVRDALHPPRQ
jgi:hypothetical protein